MFLHFFMIFKDKSCFHSHSIHSSFYQLTFKILVEGALASRPPLPETVRPPMSVGKFTAIAVSTVKFWLYIPQKNRSCYASGVEEERLGGWSPLAVT